MAYFFGIVLSNSGLHPNILSISFAMRMDAGKPRMFYQVEIEPGAYRYNLWTAERFSSFFLQRLQF
mgnify:CR=1 FL=1